MKKEYRKRLGAILGALAILIWQPCSFFGSGYIFGAEGQDGEKDTEALWAISEKGETYEEGMWTAGKLRLQYKPAGHESTAVQFACIEEGDTWGEETDWQEMSVNFGADIYEAKLPELESGIYQVYIRNDDCKDKEETEEDKKGKETVEESREPPGEPRAMLKLMIDQTAPKITELKLLESAQVSGQNRKYVEIMNEIEGRKITGHSFQAAACAEDSHSGILGYWYRWNSDEEFRFRKADSNGKAQISAKPEEMSCEGRFEIYAEDNVGNCPAERETIQYLYDSKPPVIDTKQMKINPLTREGNADYSVDLMRISPNSVKYWQKYGVEISGIVIHDTDESNGVSSGIEAVRAEKNGKPVKCQVEPEADGRINDDRQRSVKLKITGDSIDAPGDRIRIIAEDQAGNRTVTGEIVVKTDHEKPEPVKITLFNSDGKLLLPFPAFIENRYFSNQPVTAVLEAGDRLSGIEEIFYRLSDDEPFRKVSGGRRTLLLMPGYEGRITAYAVDRTGNSNELRPSRSGRTVCENIPPEISIKSSPDAGRWQRDNIHFQIRVRDSETASGLRTVICRLNGKEAVSKDYTTEESPRKEDTIEITAAEEARTEEGYLLKVEALDLAGNRSVKQIRVRIDRRSPEAELSGVEDGGVYRENKTVNLKFREQNYHGMKGEAVVTRTEPGGTKEQKTLKFKMDAEECLREFSCTDEGIYILQIRARDAAGNQMKELMLSFTIDKTSPEVKLSGIKEGEYYDQPVSLEIVVMEAFYEKNAVEIKGTRELDGKINPVVPERWTNDGIRTEWIQNFSEDGTYEIVVQAEDEAGNSSGREKISFTVDRTPPRIAVAGMKDYEISAAPVQLGIKVTESNYNTSEVRVSAVRENQEGRKTEEKLEPFIPEKKETKQKFRFQKDGIYRLTVNAEDRAGNHTKEVRRLIIDTESPVIRFIEQVDGRYLKEFKLPGHGAVVDDLTLPKYRIYLNGLEYSESEVIRREGSYRLRIEAEDEAGHKSRAAARFIIDRTPPEIKWFGIDNRKVINGPANLSLKVEEGEKLEDITINGKKQLGKPMKRYSCNLNRPGTYIIKASAVDQAGNQVREKRVIEIQTVNASDNQKSKITPALVLAAMGGIAAAAILAAGIPTMLIHMKKYY